VRVGVVFPAREPSSPGQWSGTPRGLADGLHAQGVDVVALGTSLGPDLHTVLSVTSRIDGRSGPVLARSAARTAARGRSIARTVRRALPLDGLVAMGTDMYELVGVVPQSLPVVTYDDGTLLQMWRNPGSDIRRAGFLEREVVRWFQVQRRGALAASACCVSTSWAARSFVDDYGVPAGQVHVVGMGHRARASVAGERDWSVPRLLFVGVDWRRKNGDAVVRAFRALQESVPAATLDVVGGHPSLDGIPGITGHGLLRRDDPAAQARLDGLFARATVFVLPSLFDPSPIAYLEAASAGLPVVATTEGGASELLGAGAIAVRPDDQAAIDAAVRRLSDPEVARVTGAEAAARATSSTWDEVASRVLRVLGACSHTEGDS